MSLGRALCLALALGGGILGAAAGFAQGMDEKHLPLDGWISEDGKTVNLTWRDAPRAHRGPVEIARRDYGMSGGETWAPVKVVRQSGMRITDPGTQAGQAYEYRILRRDADGGIVDAGYWLTGRDVAERETRGTAHVVVEASMVQPLAQHLNRFSRDLLGDGWQVRTYAVPRHLDGDPKANLQAVDVIKQQLSAAYQADPFGDHAVILVGHVPLVTSGRSNPDGHDPEPHATDLIYGDVDGRWQFTPEGQLLDNALPSDAIEMQVGRIDFAGVSAADAGPNRGPSLDTEAHLLRAYFDKNHNWRHGRLGDLRVAYGRDKGLAGELYGLRNIVGPDAIATGGHHDVGQERPWLWGVDFGDHNGRNYAADYAIKAVFAINFGSVKQKIDRPFNPMTALLAQPWYPLAVGWGGRPAWWLHPMALGGSVGEVHMRTVNNGRAADPYADSMDYIPTGQYLWRNPVWVNLLGDPTLRAFPLASPGLVLAEPDETGLRLSWDASNDPDVLGYRVYKRQNDGAAFQRISGAAPLDGLEFIDPDGDDEAVYMVRALGRKEVHAGSFRTLSQGVFAHAGRAPVTVRDAQISGPVDMPLDLPEIFNAPRDMLIAGLVSGPPRGMLRFEDGGWRYIPPAGFTGSIELPFVVSDDLSTGTGILSLRIAP